MTAEVRAIQPAALVPSWEFRQISEVTITTTALAYPIGMARDGRSFFGSMGTSFGGSNVVLKQSVDDGVTWTNINTFADAVTGILELDDGEALVTTQTTGSPTVSKVYRSTGWSTSRTTATWALVLTTVGGYIRRHWSLTPWSASGPVVVVNEYGGQTTSTSDTQNATRLYLSTNYGATWTMILDIGPGRVGVHQHGSAYDPEWDRIWITFGDNTGDGQAIAGAGNCQIGYSDDRGATWQFLPLPSDGWPNIQVTGIVILEDALVFTTDGDPVAVQVYPRLGYRKMGPMRLGAQPYGNTGSQAIGIGCYRVPGKRHLPALMTIQPAGTKAENYIFAIDDGGLSSYELYRETSGPAITDAVGPSINGVVVCRKGAIIMRAILARPEPRSVPTGGTASIVDGGTIAHGLGRIPTRYQVTPTVANRTAAVTAVSATTLTVALKDNLGAAIAAAEPVAWLAATETSN